jgi:hypothetical protein
MIREAITRGVTAENPSGPDALSGGQALITDQTSSSQNHAQMPDKSTRRRPRRSSFTRHALVGGAARIPSKKSSARLTLTSFDTAK